MDKKNIFHLFVTEANSIARPVNRSLRDVDTHYMYEGSVYTRRLLFGNLRANLRSPELQHPLLFMGNTDKRNIRQEWERQIAARCPHNPSLKEFSGYHTLDSLPMSKDRKAKLIATLLQGGKAASLIERAALNTISESEIVSPEDIHKELCK